MKKTYFAVLLPALLVAFNASTVQINGINVKGLQRVERETVLSYVDIEPNSDVSEETLNDAFKKLYTTGLFSDIKFVVSQGVLNINVSENPIVNKRYFDGNDKVEDKMLESEVQLAPRSIYSVAKVQEDTKRILNVYKRVGRYAAVVEPKVIERDQNRVDLIYEIDEGPLAKITKINFVGNKHYSDSTLQSEILSKETRWWRIFSSSENYDPEKSKYDQELLRRFYLKRGYADFRVVSSVAELSPDKESFVITTVLEEGNRYKIGDINVRSTISNINEEDVKDEIDIDSGDWYNAEKVDDSVYALTEELGKKGFAFVEVEPVLNKNMEKGVIDLTFQIREGSRIFVNQINISGNTRTHDDVIRREFRINEGDAFNASKIRASRRNIENLNYFSKVDIQTAQTPDPNKADINVDVEEKSTGYFNIGVGYSTVNGALVRAGVTENNFRGKGQQVGIDLGISQREQDYNINFTEPYFLGLPLSAGIDLFRTETDYQDEASYDETVTGGRVRFGWKYTDNLSQSVRYTLKQDEIDNVSKNSSIYIQREEGKYLDSAVGQTLVYDKRDSAIDPRSGYYLSFGNDVSGLGGDDKYLRFDAKSYLYYSFFEDITLKMFLNGGYVTGYGDENVRLAQRYFLGGSTMRGFETAGIGARDRRTNDALGGNWMVYGGSELMFPIGLDEVGIKGRTFVDVGTIGKPDAINMDDVYYSSKPRVSVGFGFTWLSPMGKIDIDFGFPVVKEKYDETEVFRLNFGARL
ncbi:MAG: outer membrane protein assembly factor BamA [Alphaproteobacteria bacterium]|nr:outer membrane protein assembly factor BamA [Alphaproteobacteria bacterium]